MVLSKVAGAAGWVTEKTHNLSFFFFIVVLVHLADVFLGRMGTHQLSDVFFMVIYTLLALWGGFGRLFGGDGEPFIARIKYVLYLAVIGALAVYIPLIAYKLFDWFSAGPTITTFVLVFAPIYPLMLFFQRGDDIGWGNKFMKWYIVIWLLVLIFSNPQWFTAASQNTANLLGITQDSVTVTPGAFILGTFKGAYEGVLNLINATRTSTQKQIEYATGDAYTARVDQKAKTQIGVKLDSLQTTQATYPISGQVGAYTRLTAQTLDEPLKITVTCSGVNTAGGSVVAPRTISPTTVVEIAQEEALDIDCDFNGGAFQPGSATIKVTADFTMKTLAYLKTYFMTRDRLRELRNAKIDPFTQYGITDRNPVTIYTSGPVSIALGFSGTPPIGIDTTVDEFTGTLGMTITNVWQGKIKSLNTIYVLVPRGFTVTELTGVEAQIVKTNCVDLPTISDWCDDSIANLYTITAPGGFSTTLDTQPSITLRMRLRAPQSEYERILGTTPISTKYFKAAADYTYSMVAERGVTIVGTTGGSGGGTASQVVTLIGVPAVDAKSTTANVTFETNVASATEMRYCQGTNTASCAKLIISSAPTSATKHAHFIQGLLPNAFYAYDLYGFSTACPSNKCKLNDAALTFQTTASDP